LEGPRSGSRRPESDFSPIFGFAAEKDLAKNIGYYRTPPSSAPQSPIAAFRGDPPEFYFARLAQNRYG
jgi:hypothetical protein